MTVKYADRAFISVNGTPVIDLQSFSLKRNNNARVVPSMTRDGRNKGFVQGNADFDLTATVAVRNGSPSPKLEDIDFEANDVQLTAEVGADRYTATGLFNKDTDTTTGGVGDEGKKTFNFGALDVVDQVGNGILFDLAL